MIHVLLPDSCVRPLSFYLAMEEFLAARDGQDYFFMWQVEPTVIIGRNQHLLSEVNVEYCRENGISIVRRRSGGGCVYADMNNVMFSYITTSAEVTATFGEYTALVAGMLKSIGVDARVGGRNDILVGDRKISGNAFYHRRGRAIVHGTMLYNTDMEAMLHAITPSTLKLTSKGVESVRSRVVNLTELTDIGLEDFKARAAAFMCDTTLTLTAADVAAIEEIERHYDAPAWLNGSAGATAGGERRRVEGVGELRPVVTLKGDRITDVTLTGDFFLLSDLDDGLLDRLRGCQYTHDAITASLSDVNVADVIAGIDNEKFIDLII